MYKDNGQGTLLIRRGTKEEIEKLQERYEKALDKHLGLKKSFSERKDTLKKSSEQLSILILAHL